MHRFGTAKWSGNLKEGGGAISTQSGVLNDAPFALLTRFGEKPGTNPEELIGAAHAGCFTMALTAMLGDAGFTPDNLDTKSVVTFEKEGTGFAITAVHLSVVATISGIDDKAFQDIAAEAKAGCPVSRVLNAPITFEASLTR